MEITLVRGATAFEAGKSTIKKIDTKDMTQKNYVVVPDTFSMQAEKLLFDELGIKATFNIEVVGISKLASRILRENNVAFARISGLEEVFNVFQAVKECESDFKYFEKCDIEFCQKILEIIKQFKSCKIKPENIKPTKNELLNNKMHDLKLVYEHYENLLGEKFDLSKLLEYSVQNVQNFKNLSNLNLYFVNFDSFSLEIGNFICKLAEYVNKIYIGMAYPLSVNNGYIYEDDIKSKITKLAGEKGAKPKVEEDFSQPTGKRRKIVENLFGFSVEQGKSDYFVNVLATNRQDEVDFVAKYIKREVFKGARFNDFAVAISSDTYYDKIRTTFEKYGIVTYTDDAVNLSQTMLGRFVLKVFEIARLGFDMPNLQWLVSCDLLGEDKESLHDINFYQIDDEKEFLERHQTYSWIVSKINSLKKCKLAQDYVGCLKELVGFVGENYKNIVNRLEEERFYKKSSENTQSLELISQVFEKISELGGKQEFSVFDFENLVKISLQSVKVETIPSYIDAVFVGDATKSYFEDVKVLFVLGANAKELPKTQADTGIIDDNDIKELKFNYALEPEIKVLNRRARLKLFECLQHAQEKLIVCCPSAGDDKISQFVFDLRKMFGENVLNTANMGLSIDSAKSKKERFDDLLLCLGSEDKFLENYSALQANKMIPVKLEGMLKSIAGEFPKEKEYKFIPKEDAQKLLKSKISVTSLETYFACPFRFFVEKSLGVKELEIYMPDKRNFGSFEHDLLENFVSQYNLKEEKIDCVNEFLKKNMLKIAKKYYDEKTLSEKSFVKYLENESKIILKNVLHEAKYSKFVPKYFEYGVSKKVDKNLTLCGIIDRVDVFENRFRVLDYKTGEQKGIKDSLFCGKKLQLFIYAKALKEQLGLDCSGVYYFNCQTKYNSKSKLKLLHGMTKNDYDVVVASDYRLAEYGQKSDILSVTAKKNPNKGEEFYDRSKLLVKNFDKTFDYAEKIAINAHKEMQEGYIEDKPLADSCKNCPYISVCMHREEDGQRKILSAKDVF